jgi:hypothetical protein
LLAGEENENKECKKSLLDKIFSKAFKCGGINSFTILIGK